MSELNPDSSLKFPTTISIKCFGENCDDFDIHVAQIVRQHCDNLCEGAVTTRPSTGKKFIAVSVKVTLTDRARADRLFQALSDDPKIIMTV
jgi:putative lipoic acid-binding regulatory protein